MKEKKDNEKKFRMNGEKKFYLFTALGCAAVLLAVIIVAVAVTNNSKVNEGLKNPTSSSVIEQPDDEKPNEKPDEKPDDKPVEEPVGGVEGMVMPLEKVSVSNDYGFYHNQTLNFYYEHQGVDFVAPVGTEVFAVEAGVIESIYKDDLLSGTEIVVDHGNNLKSVYRFVAEVEGLKVGDKVEKGQQIATVAEANGDEYKDGAHLHFEILQNGKHVDPAVHLTLAEK